MIPNTYQTNVTSLAEELAEARGALPRDIAAAVSTRQWDSFLRDRYDVEALAAEIDALGRNLEFVGRLHAAADKARQQLRGRGRPRKAVIASGKTPPATATVVKHEKKEEPVIRTA